MEAATEQRRKMEQIHAVAARPWLRPAAAAAAACLAERAQGVPDYVIVCSRQGDSGQPGSGAATTCARSPRSASVGRPGSERAGGAGADGRTDGLHLLVACCSPRP